MKKVMLITDKMPYEIEEQINTLRTNIQFAGRNKKVILITSCVGSEGKSTTTFRLACSMAELGKKVLLIDTDMRKSVLAGRAVRGVPKVGLSHYLSGQNEFSEILYATNVENLHVIFAGQIPPNPTELLDSESYSDMIRLARDYYDYIFVDTAPLGMVIDAAIVAKNSDGAVILIEAGKIRYKTAQDVKARLELANCPVIGVVLNKVERGSSGYYYKQYYKKYEKYGETQPKKGRETKRARKPR